MSASTSMAKKTQTQGLSSSLNIDEDTTMLMQKKQGIVTILGSDCETNTASASSLRRTLSADMSSKKWLSQNGSSPMKKIASSEELLHNKAIADSLSSSSEDDYEERKQLEAEAEAERERLEIWSSIQRNKKEEQEKAGQFDTWSSIMSLKANDEISKSLPVTPYIHPLVKRSKSSLSEKSLEICTESLGSETGFDGMFSSSPSSDAEEDKEDELDQKQQQQQQQQQEKVIEPAYEPEEEELHVPRHNYAAASTKKSPPRSFPPPLPSLSRQHGPSFQMRSHRDNGRLVLEAVSVSSQNNFCVQRQDGRLVLTFANHHEKQPKGDADEVAEKEGKDHVEELLEEEFEEGDEEGKEHEGDDDDDETEEEEEVRESESDVRDDVETVIEKAPLLSSGITTSVHRLPLMMKKPIGLVNRNPTWSDKFNQMVNFGDVNVVEPSLVPKSLPPRPRVARLIPSTPDVASPAAAAASFNINAYEYYWRTKPTAKAAPVPNPLTHQQNNNSPLKNNSSKLIVSGDMNPISNHEQQQLLVLRGKNGDYLVHNLKSCKDSRRSFLFWEPNYIATS